MRPENRGWSILRTLELFFYIKENSLKRPYNLDTLAARFSCSSRTVKRDVDMLVALRLLPMPERRALKLEEYVSRADKWRRTHGDKLRGHGQRPRNPSRFYAATAMHEDPEVLFAGRPEILANYRDLLREVFAEVDKIKR